MVTGLDMTMAEQQQRVPVGVRFREAGKVYYFDGRKFDLSVGDYVVVETSHGEEVGRVVIAPDQVIATEIKESLKPVIREATEEDVERSRELKEKAREDTFTARRRVSELGLDMHVVGGEYELSGSQVTFYFTAEERVDFRSLVRDLASELGARVQLLQVGDRDRAKMVDGMGRCGLRLCCASWATAFPTVSIRMAKEQELPLNPSKISGVCGRLLCCLTYEYESYRELRGTLPKVGSTVSTPVGEAKVSAINFMRNTVTLFIKESREVLEMPVAEMQMQYGLTVRPQELVESLERPLQETEVVEAAAPESGPAPTEPTEAVEPAGEPGEEPAEEAAQAPAAPVTAAGQQQQPAEAGARRRRWRGRRGGRGRRHGGNGARG